MLMGAGIGRNSDTLELRELGGFADSGFLSRMVSGRCFCALL